MAIGGRGWLIYLLSQNKQIQLWHQQLAYANNIQVVKTFKLIDSIDLNLINSREHNLFKVLVNSNNFETSTNENKLPNSSTL